MCVFRRKGEGDAEDGGGRGRGGGVGQRKSSAAATPTPPPPISSAVLQGNQKTPAMPFALWANRRVLESSSLLKPKRQVSFSFPLEGAVPPSLPKRFWDWFAPHRALCLTCSLWSVWSLKARGRDGRWSSASLGTQAHYCFRHGLIPRSLPSLSVSASCSWIKCFLLLNHIMHLPEALLRFSLWGIVCVKPTELKVLQHLLLPTPRRQSLCRPFCIPAAKC